MAENMLPIWHKLTERQQEFLYNNLDKSKGSKRHKLEISEMMFMPFHEVFEAHDNFFRRDHELPPSPGTIYDLLIHGNPEALKIRAILES